MRGGDPGDRRRVPLPHAVGVPSADPPPADLSLADLPLVDHHCHGLVRRDLTRPEYERMLTEADTPAPAGTTYFDSQVGFAVRRWCAPVLDLPAHATPDDYLARRTELGAAEVSGRMLRAAGIAVFCVDAGWSPESLLSAADIATAAGGRGYDVIRLEPIAEQVALDIVTGQVGIAHFADTVRARLAARAETAVGVKSVAAYRVGLDLPAERPTDRAVIAAVRTWVGRLRSGAPIRAADPVLHAFLIWCGVDLGLPVQIHVGYGDTDLHLARCNPLLLTDLLRALEPAGAPVALLHCYPFHREAGYLAQVFPHVYLDVGLATHNLGRGSIALLAEALELAPFGKLLFSTDAFALAELYLLGARLFRRGLAAFLDAGVADGDWTAADAARIARLIGADNARRVYRFDEVDAGLPAATAPGRSDTDRSDEGSRVAPRPAPGEREPGSEPRSERDRLVSGRRPAGTGPATGAPPGPASPDGPRPATRPDERRSRSLRPASEPSRSEPSRSEPSGSELVRSDPAGSDASGPDQPGSDRPVADPSGAEPAAADQPAADQPAAERPGAGRTGPEAAGQGASGPRRPRRPGR
jgi:hypothetical protein